MGCVDEVDFIFSVFAFDVECCVWFYRVCFVSDDDVVVG